jgi:hypothetical protein
MASKTAALRTPTNFPELCALSDSELAHCDIALVDLLCAEGLQGSEQIDVPTALAQLDLMAERIRIETARHRYRFHQHPEEFNNSEGYFQMMLLVTVLQQDFGLRYNPARAFPPDGTLEPNESFFADSKDSFIHGLVRPGGMGTCASLPILHLALGRRLGYPLKLVKAKLHLFVRWEDERERFNIESTSLGFISQPDEYYLTFPMAITPKEARDEFYLQSLTPLQEASVILFTRGLCLDATKDHMKALGAFNQAYKREPRFLSNRQLLARAEGIAADAGLLPRRIVLMRELEKMELPSGSAQIYFSRERSRISGLAAQGASDDELEQEIAVLRAELMSR